MFINPNPSSTFVSHFLSGFLSWFLLPEVFLAWRWTTLTDWAALFQPHIVRLSGCERLAGKRRGWEVAESLPKQVAEPSRCHGEAAKQIMSCLDYLRDLDYSGESPSRSAPSWFCSDQLFSAPSCGPQLSLTCLRPVSAAQTPITLKITSLYHDRHICKFNYAWMFAEVGKDSGAEARSDPKRCRDEEDFSHTNSVVKGV